MLWCRTACGYMWITRSPSTYPQKSRSRWRAGPRPASVAPMNDYEPIPGEPTATMFQSLEQIRRQTLQRCTATVGQSDRQLLFGMTTALELQGVPVPSHCNLDTAALHVTVRTRSGRPHIRPLKSVPVIVHIWSHCTPQSLIHISNGVHALHVFHVWAQLSPYLSTEDLVVLGDSILTMLVRNGAPDADKLYLELQRFIKEMPPFRGKSICRQAMTLVRPNIRSPAGSSLRLGVQRHGIPDGRCNVVVPGITFRSGAAISLDIAWVEFKVGVEYDGDHHRTDKVQWRRDNEKRERLRAHGWILIIVTAQNLIDEMSIAELALRIARRLAERGASRSSQSA